MHGIYPAFPSGLPESWKTWYYPVQIPFDYKVEQLPTRHHEMANVTRPQKSAYDHEISTAHHASDPSLEKAQLLDCTQRFKPFVTKAD
jgi:hypothetical protein